MKCYSMSSYNVAIIPARTGSKRIPGKNTKDLCGKPLIEWTIEAAIQSDVFDLIIIDTDDIALAEYANPSTHVRFHLRDEGASDDVTPVSVPVLRLMSDIPCNKVTLLMATSPLRTARDIIDAHITYILSETKFQVSAYEVPGYHWGIKTGLNGRALPINKKALSMRSQDLEKVYLPTGAIWIADYKELMEQGTFYGKGYKLFCMDDVNGLDIDTMDDFKKAEMYMKYRLDIR